MTQIYHYDKNTSELVGNSEARLDPIDDLILVPAQATTQAPPNEGANQTAVWNGSDWELVADYRGYLGYNAAGDEQTISLLNVEPDADWTTEPPFILTDAQAIKVATINAATAAAIISGFSSAALGADTRYQSEQEDQLNLLGLATSATDQPFKCSDDDGTTWAYVLHTAAQLITVMNDGIAHKMSALQAGEILKAQVAALPGDANQDDVDLIS